MKSLKNCHSSTKLNFFISDDIYTQGLGFEFCILVNITSLFADTADADTLHCTVLSYFLKGIHYMQGWTATASDAVARKNRENQNHTRKVFRKIPEKECVY